MRERERERERKELVADAGMRYWRKVLITLSCSVEVGFWRTCFMVSVTFTHRAVARRGMPRRPVWCIFTREGPVLQLRAAFPQRHRPSCCLSITSQEAAICHNTVPSSLCPTAVSGPCKRCLGSDMFVCVYIYTGNVASLTATLASGDFNWNLVFFACTISISFSL